MDLGAWASENYKVPVKDQAYNEAELEQIYSALEAAETVAGDKQEE